MSTDPWNPKQYHQFQKERQKPFFDLLAMVQKRPRMHVIDLGCGTGELTQHMHRSLDAESTLGIDNSDQMLRQANTYVEEGLTFLKQDLQTFQLSQKYDLIFSNAALQWVDNHSELFNRLKEALNPEGQLAIQLPYMEDHPFHTLSREVAESVPFSEELKGFVQHLEVWPPEYYVELLYRLGFQEQIVRMHVYAHLLPSRNDVIEWHRGTLLTAYQKRLAPTSYEQFVTQYRQKIEATFPNEEPFFFPYKRLLIWARK